MYRNEMEELWTVDGVATYLKLTPKTIRNRVSLSTIPFVKVGRSVRFRPDEIRMWIATETAAARKTHPTSAKDTA